MTRTTIILSLSLLALLPNNSNAFANRESHCRNSFLNLPSACLYLKPSSCYVHETTTFNLQMQNDNEEKQLPENPLTTKTIITRSISMIGIFSSLILFWDEGSIVLTRCGPILLSDAIESSSYIATFILASGSNLSRIIYGSSLTSLLLEEEEGFSKAIFRASEMLSIMAVLGAFVVFAWQALSGDAFADGAGLSGIDVRWCRLMNEG